MKFQLCWRNFRDEQNVDRDAVWLTYCL